MKRTALDRGWVFKKERQEGLLSRRDNPVVKLLIAEQALLHLALLRMPLAESGSTA